MKLTTYFNFILTIAFALMVSINLTAQALESPEETVHRFFRAMAQSDTVIMSKLMSSKATLVSSYMKDGKYRSGGGDKHKFMESVINAEPGELDEQISNLRTQQDDGLATVWMDYAFYHKGEFSHCGVNTFTLVQKEKDWLIVSLSDTRRKSNCQIVNSKQAIDDMLIRWHKAASDADSLTYFGLMTTDAIYVGTDKTEVWRKDEFLSFAAPYFAKGKAWDFTTVSRNIYSEDFKSMAWFDEVLDTWMGPCRGSGVVVKDEDGEWKVKHYVLSVTVSNDEIKEFMKIGN